MAGRIARSTRMAVALTLLGAMLLYSAWRADEFVPIAWRGPVVAGWGGGRMGGQAVPIPLTDAGTLFLGGSYSMTTTATARTSGWFVVTEIELNVAPVSFIYNGAPATPAEENRILRQTKLDSLKAQCLGLVGFAPGASGVVDRAFASPGTTVSQAFSERVWADWLLVGRAVMLCVCLLGTLAATGWLGVRVVAEVNQRRNARRMGCAACGYSRAGLDASVPCPECGLQPPREGEFYEGRLTRKARPPVG